MTQLAIRTILYPYKEVIEIKGMSFIRDYLEANPELAELSAEDLKKHLEYEGFSGADDDYSEVFASAARAQNKVDSKVEQFLEDQRL